MDQVTVSALPANSKGYSTEVGKTGGRGGRNLALPESGVSFPEVIDSASQNSSGADAKSPAADTANSGQEHRFKLWETDDFSFGDIVDIINPLQHLPIVATIYRKMTDDKIGLAPRVIGGALWGRIGGFVSGLINAASEWLTGKDIGDHIYTAVFGPHEKSSPTLIAQASQAATATELPSRAIEQAQSSFPGFNDDGGFSPGPALAHQVASVEEALPIAHLAAAAVSSYNQNSELSEADEPFRLRFPA